MMMMMMMIIIIIIKQKFCDLNTTDIIILCQMFDPSHFGPEASGRAQIKLPPYLFEIFLATVRTMMQTVTGFNKPLPSEPNETPVDPNLRLEKLNGIYKQVYRKYH